MIISFHIFLKFHNLFLPGIALRVLKLHVLSYREQNKQHNTYFNKNNIKTNQPHHLMGEVVEFGEKYETLVSKTHLWSPT